jgi:tyrosine-protein phosphatase OCA1
MCRTGRYLSGVVIGCFRKLHKWSLVSIFEEYRRFAGSKFQQQNEQFIELFDVDLVAVPSPSHSA